MTTGRSDEDDAAFAAHVRALGRGPGRARHLTRAEAADAMARILDGRAAPEAVGALLMLMRYRGESADEIAGFVDAMRARARPWAGIGATLDWPSYAAGRSRGAPWFVLAALLAARGGARVFMHGYNSHMSHPLHTRAALEALGIAPARTPAEAAAALAATGLAYAPLEAIDPELLRVLRLRKVLGLRSPANTALKLFDPAGAGASVQGVFHPSYRALQQQAAALLGARSMIAVKGGGGEAERVPAKRVELFRLEHGRAFEETAPPLIEAPARRHAEPEPSAARFLAVWRGEEDDPYAAATVAGTAALALLSAGLAPDLEAAEARAWALWRARMDEAA
ncbi:glycosyl transferase family protein [Oceanicella actignis]|uniref:Anthranilate phosphoribosyltransferase n=1 Tax=Oceanicella actignis TaxID=1189325 RepID=A0A1M7S188_9RHOB|nr:glycosyl transferase family protein [Oceanicella actignis]SES92287.1 Anthranilate phosphoribosyltransferase [Oceanicella actignis]SHN52248.1 Anthranilate phosphoribosyltransferase [Oceanicella actignis]